MQAHSPGEQVQVTTPRSYSTMTEPLTAITSSLTSQTNLSCFGDSDGAVVITASGGTGILTYNWQPSGGTSASAIGLVADSYTCTINDSNACSIEQMVTITQPIAITSAQTINLCAGESVTIGVNTYSVSGVYNDIFPAANGCDSTLTTTLTVNNAIDISLTLNTNIITANEVGATYQWIDCKNANVPISGATAQAYTVTVNGDYAVVVTKNNCIDTSYCMIVNLTGISSLKNNIDMQLYPNPTDGTTTVYFENIQHTINVRIKNILGEIISDNKYPESKSIDLFIKSNAGIYFIDVQLENGQSKVFRVFKN